MKSIYNPQTKKIEEQPEMKEPKTMKSGWYENNEIGRQQYQTDWRKYKEQKDLCKTYDVSGVPDDWEGRELKPDVDYKLEKRSPDGFFVKGNYCNTCTKCKKTFYNTDKLWFWCEECCNEIVAVPIENKKEEVKESEDELWRKLVDEITVWHHDVKDATQPKEFIQQLKKSFTLKENK